MTDDADKQIIEWLTGSLEAMDAAFGRPYDAAPVKVRAGVWLHACRGLPEEAVAWATKVACRSLEKYPVPAQFRRLAQGSPAYQAQLDARARSQAPMEERSITVCEVCQEPRAWHRVRPYSDAPRPLVIRGVRHKDACPHRLVDESPGWWVDPPMFGQLTQDAEAWRAVDGEWSPRPVVPGEPVAPIAVTVETTSQAERDERAAQYKHAAQEAQHGHD